MHIEPMLCEIGDPALLDELTDKEWVVEKKYDGERIIAQLEKGRVSLWTRRDLDVAHKFPEIVDSIMSLNDRQHIVLDGELTVEGGFENLHKRQTEDRLEIKVLSRKLPATYSVFDILIVDGKEVMNRSLARRKELLVKAFPSDVVRLELTRNYGARNAKETFETLVGGGAEGVIAKRLSSKYTSGKRSPDWLKFKRSQTVDVEIIGARKSETDLPFASLIMMRDGKYFGCVGSGFTLSQRKDIMEMLRKHAVKKPAVDIPKEVVPIVVTEPLLAEIVANEVNDKGMPRAPVWLRFRTY